MLMGFANDTVDCAEGAEVLASRAMAASQLLTSISPAGC